MRPKRWLLLLEWLQTPKVKFGLISFVLGVVTLVICALMAGDSSERKRELERDRGLKAYRNGDYQSALSIWRPLGDSGDGTAQALIAHAYEKGTGVPQDLREAHRWLARSAENGHRFSQLQLGRSYEVGEIARQDFPEAAKWYRRSALQGTVQAQTLLGLFYLEGRGVPQDYVRAHMWLNISASNERQDDNFDLNLPSAKVTRDKITARMTPAQVALAQEGARRCLDSKYSKCDP